MAPEVSVYETAEDGSDLAICHELWIVMEYVSGGTLGYAASHEFRFGDLEMAYIAREILQALDFIHTKDYIHRDIKPDNLMYDQTTGKIKLIDFGLSVKNDGGHGVKPHLVGSPQWMSPEIIRRRPHTFTTDVWSLAACLQTIGNQGYVAPIEESSSSSPQSPSSPEVEQHFLRVMFRAATIGAAGEGLKDKTRWSDNFRDFLAGCLDPNPMTRPAPRKMLQHIFITSLDEAGYGASQFRSKLTSFLKSKEKGKGSKRTSLRTHLDDLLGY